MNIKKAIAFVGFLAATAGVPMIALAQQDAVFYIGGSVGRTEFDVDTSGVTALGVTSLALDDRDTGWKIYGGYQFNRNWGAELGYVDLGTVGFSGVVLGVPFTGNADVTAWTLSGVGTLPLSDSFSLFGKVGLYNWKTKASASVAGVAVAVDDKGTDPLVGVGLRYNFTKNVGIQVEAEHYGGDDKANVFSIGLRVKF